MCQFDLYSDYERFTVLFERGFDWEFRWINQLALNYPCLWRLIFVPNFVDTFPSITKLDNNFWNALYTHTARLFTNLHFADFWCERKQIKLEGVACELREVFVAVI